MKFWGFFQRASLVLGSVSVWASVGCVVPISSNPSTTTDGGGDGAVVVPTGGDAGPGPGADAGSPPDGGESSDGGGGTTTSEGGWAMVAANLQGLTSGCGNLGYVAANPGEDTVVVSIANQGIFDSTNGATQWTPLGTGSGAGLGSGGAEILDNNTNLFVFDPVQTHTYWEVGNHGTGIYVTTDDGHTFTALGLGTGVDSLGIDFNDPARATMIAGGHEIHSVFRSTDSGKTWTDLGSNIPANAGTTAEVLLLSPQIHLASSYGGTSDGIYRTTDGGKTWTQVYSGGGIRSHGLVTSDAIYWVLYESEPKNQGVIKSTDQGVTWTKLPGTDSVFTTENGILALPQGRLGVRGSMGLLVSADKGATWQSAGPAFPFQPAGLAYSTYRNKLFAWQWQCAGNGDPIPADDLAALSISFN